MRMDVNHKKRGFWTKYLFLTFVLILILSLCSSEKSGALKEKKRFAMQGKHLSTEDKSFVMQDKHFMIQDENFIVEKLNDSKVMPTFVQAINNGAQGKSKRVSNYTIGKLKPYYYPDCTISIRDDLIQSQGDKALFHTSLMSQIYYFEEAISMYTLDSELYFNSFVKTFEQAKKIKVIEKSNKLKREISRDGVSYNVGYFKTQEDDFISYFSIIMVPQKNLILTHILSFNHVEPEKKSVLEELELLHKNIIFHKGNQDYVSGNTFSTEYNSKLVLKNDKTYEFQRSKNDPMRGFNEGNYEVFYGEEAFKKLTSLHGYDISREELERELEHNMTKGISLEEEVSADYLSNHEEEDKKTQEEPKKYSVCKDTFYAIILHDKNSATTKSKKEKKGDYTLYVGYYIQEEKALSLLNANAGSSVIWRFVKKTQNN